MHAEAWFNDVADVLRRLRTDGARDAELEEAVRSLAKDGAAVTVEELAMNCGLARRQFERRFKACTGFSPALFQRILRFQRTYRLLENGVARNLTDVALEAGLIVHFIRDFKRWGMDPKQYFRHAPEKVDASCGCHDAIVNSHCSERVVLHHEKPNLPAGRNRWCPISW